MEQGPILLPFTIWRFRGVTIPQERIVAKQTEPFEPEHEYQQVLGRVEAYNAREALRKFKAGATP